MEIGETTPLPQAPPSGVTEFEALRVGFIAADAALRRRAVAQREADERQILMMREVDHRAKNALAVALSLVRLAPRNVPPKVFASAVEGRVAAMARAHSCLPKGHGLVVTSGPSLRASWLRTRSAFISAVRQRISRLGPCSPWRCCCTS